MGAYKFGEYRIALEILGLWDFAGLVADPKGFGAKSRIE